MLKFTPLVWTWCYNPRIAQKLHQFHQFSLYVLYPARIPAENTTQLAELQRFAEFVEGGPGREDVQQALFQLAGLVMTVVVSLTTGLLTGNDFTFMSMICFWILPSTDY